MSVTTGAPAVPPQSPPPSPVPKVAEPAISTRLAPPAHPARPARPARPSKPPRPAGAAPPRPALERPRECAVTGVSAGIARHLGAPVWAVRALFVVLAFALGAGILLYLWCWAFTPWEAGSSSPTRAAPVAWALVVLAGIGLAIALFAVSEYATWGAWASLIYVRMLGGFALAVVAATFAGVWAGFIDRTDPSRGPRHAVWTRVVAIAILAVTLVTAPGAGGNTLQSVVSALIPIFAILIVLSPALVQRWRELSGERVARIREEQRAEMAAHLHDSVLQTLALIQNRGGASSEVARLARAQERELRAWLYDGDQPADSDLPTDLRDYAGALELDYPVRIDVVAAGTSTERASGEVAAAAREAMLNAARHAGGEVSVYIEGSGRGVDVYIRDRGAGFELAAVPDDRLGIRQSIIGRMRRAGGSATVTSGPDGTEVHLRYEREVDRG
ncbi:MAG: ATP-binding protein [Microbacterium sp.]|nr:MAG: ATP-binding protein [Microbacterium sp.]